MGDFNELSPEERKVAFETLGKMGHLWLASLVLLILFWLGFSGFDFLNLKGFFPVFALFSNWVYFVLCLIYVWIFSIKYYKVQNGDKVSSVWDLNRPQAKYEFNRHLSKNETFTVIDKIDIINIIAFCVIPCIFLVFGFFILLKESLINMFAILGIFLPLFSMLLQILFARNTVKYCKEVNKFVESATKRMYIFVNVSIILIVASFALALLFSLMTPLYVTIQLNNRDSMMEFYLDSNKLISCMPNGDIAFCNFSESGVAKVVDINELKETISKNNSFGLSNAEIFIGSTRKEDYFKEEIVIRRKNFVFTGFCLPNDARKGDYLDYAYGLDLTGDWNVGSKFWSESKMKNFSSLLGKLQDSNIYYYDPLEPVGRVIFTNFNICLSNEKDLNSVCCLGVIE